MTLIVYLLNVLTVFAAIAALIAFLHIFAAMKRSLGSRTMIAFPLAVGLVWAYIGYGSDHSALATAGIGFLIALGLMVVMSFVGGFLLHTRLTASEASNGYLGLRPVLLTWCGCILYSVLILSLNKLTLGQPNFWADAADLEAHGTASDH